MSEPMMDWEKFVEEQRQLQDKQNRQLQELMASSGIDLNSIPKIDLEMVDPETRQELQMKHGIDLSQVPEVKTKTASNFRMRTRAKMV